ncbi:hypothetical protein KKKH9_09360 [Helicobacter pylori]
MIISLAKERDTLSSNLKKNAKQSFAIPQNIEIKTETQTIALPKFKEGIKAKLHRDLPKDSVIKQAFISCIADQYFVLYPMKLKSLSLNLPLSKKR